MFQLPSQRLKYIVVMGLQLNQWKVTPTGMNLTLTVSYAQKDAQLVSRLIMINIMSYFRLLFFASLVVQDSVYDCLGELGLAEMQCALEGIDLEQTFRDTNKRLTVLGLTDQVIFDIELKNLSSGDIEEVLSRHAIEGRKSLSSVDFADGQSFETLFDNCFVHVTEIDMFKTGWGKRQVADGDVSL